MFTLSKYRKYIYDVHLNEKFYVVNTFNNKYLKNNFQSIVVTFYFKNSISNIDLFLSNLLLLDKLLGQKGLLIRNSKDIPSFNVKKKSIVGCLYTLRNRNLDVFLYNFFIYSIAKLNINTLLSVKHFDKITNHLTLGVNKILFFGLFDTFFDMEEFSYLYDEMIYGLDISLNTQYNDFFLNRLICSQYGFNFI